MSEKHLAQKILTLEELSRKTQKNVKNLFVSSFDTEQHFKRGMIMIGVLNCCKQGEDTNLETGNMCIRKAISVSWKKLRRKLINNLLKVYFTLILP